MKRVEVILPPNPKGVDAAVQEVINLLAVVVDPFDGAKTLYEDGLLFGKAERDGEKNIPLVPGKHRDDMLPLFDNYRVTGFFYEADPRIQNDGYVTYLLSILTRFNQNDFKADSDTRVREDLINAIVKKFKLHFFEDDFASIEVFTDTNGVWGNYDLIALGAEGFFNKPWDQFRLNFSYTRQLDC